MLYRKKAGREEPLLRVVEEAAVDSGNPVNP
jgi:hypothetical protein